jgi:hypothetical protein
VSWPIDHPPGGQTSVSGASATAGPGAAPSAQYAAASAASISTIQTAAAAFHGSHATGSTSRNAVGGCVERCPAGHWSPTLAYARVRTGYASRPRATSRAPT